MYQPSNSIDDFEVIDNFSIFQYYLNEYWEMCRNSVYQTIPRKILQPEQEILRAIYDRKVPDEIRETLVHKILSSYVMDGIIIKNEVYGATPIIIGVETTSIPIIQNVQFERHERIPVIQLF